MNSQRLAGDALLSHLSAIVASSDDAIFSKSLDGAITSWNQGAQRLYGYSEEEIIGRHVSTLIPSDRRGEEVRILERIAAGDSISHYETQRRTKDGRILDVSLTISKVEDSGGKVVGASVIARDISDQKRAQEEIATARQEAERTNRAKSEFLSRMSHELRTPLSAILGFAELLDPERLDEDQVECARHIKEAGRRMQGLINEVLDISRIEAGQFRLSLEPVPLDEVVGKDMELIGPLAAQFDVTVKTDPAAGLDGVFVKADRQRLSQVMLNLLSNAIKYNVKGGSVTVRCSRVDSGNVVIAVADTGPGIPGDKLGLLFDPFERLDADETKVQGTGLGLSVAKGLVEAMGGDLRVNSGPGRGTVFYVELESCEAEIPSVREAPVGEDAPGGASGLVLYIEDNLANIRLVKGVLRQRPGVQLISATTAATGLEKARDRRPDVILLDRHLPDGTGEEVLASLRRDPTTHEIPTVILSADAFQESVDRLKEMGADDYLTKPIDFPRFLAIVDRYARFKESA